VLAIEFVQPFEDERGQKAAIIAQVGHVYSGVLTDHNHTRVIG
jgi:hypothetical protein